MIIKQNSLTKKALYSLLVMSLLATIVSCGCVNPTSPKRLADPDMQSNSHVVDFPENTITINAPVDLNIMNFVRPGSNLTIDDVSITFSPGVDMFIADTNYLNINLANGTIVGDIKLNQRLDCENPIDDNVDNNYEIATFNIVTPDDSINDEFKIIVRITDVEVEVTKIEILIDKFHLPAGNALRGIKELYLYEDLAASDPTGTGDDNKNFLSANLIASTSVIGEMYPGSDITKLYDKDDVNDGFLIDTANTNMSNIYHRLTFDFKEKVNLKKVAIRSRQMDGYEGFYFIIRDENNHILHVQRANASSARRSADADADADATSIYSYVPSYELSRYPISDFDIKKYNNNDFTLYENTTNVILIDNFYVKQGYEYERGFVKFSRPGADIDKFNTNNVFFVYNQLMGLSLKNPPDFEMADDANGDNTYEVGTVTITNVDGGRIDFPMSVRTLDVPSTVLLKTNAVGQNAVSLTIDVYTSNIIENLLEFVDFDALGIDPATVGDIAYNYRLIGDDAIHFKTVRNTLKTSSDFGFIGNGTAINPEYNLQVEYIPDHGISEFLDVNIRVIPLTTNQDSYRVGVYTSNIIENLLNFYDTNILGIDPLFTGMEYQLTGTDASYFKIEGNALKTVGKYGFSNVFDYDRVYDLQVHYIPADGSIRHQILEIRVEIAPEWIRITPSAAWSPRSSFSAVVLTNDDILVISGRTRYTSNYGPSAQDLWLSSDEGTNWNEIQTSTASLPNYDSAAVVLKNNDIIVVDKSPKHIFKSSDKGKSWRTISTHPFNHFLAVALTNDDILLMGLKLTSFPHNSVLLSKDGGVNWSEISTPSWHNFILFEATVLNNNDILVIDAYEAKIWLSKDGGTNWTIIVENHPFTAWQEAHLVVLKNNDIILMSEGYRNEIWRSKNGGTNWHLIPIIKNNWHVLRYEFQVVVTKDNNILVMGGTTYRNNVFNMANNGILGRHFVSRDVDENYFNYVWLLSLNNKNY